MSDQTANLVAFLRKTFIFSTLDDEKLTELARSSEVVALQKDELLYAYGAASSDFCVVWTGKICLKVRQVKTEQLLGTLIAGDYFGEDFLLGNKRPESALAVQPSKVIKINRDLLLHLLQDYPKIYQLILATAKSRQFIRLRRFKWLNADEAIYMVTRKHEFFLAVHLIPPVLAALVSLTFGGFALFAQLPSFVLFVATLIGLLACLWGGWNILDWRNDYYVVTSQRVVWVEKIIALYDSRQEAPLETILSTNKVSNQTLRLFVDYATIIVRTFTVSLPLYRAKQPDLMIAFIDGLRGRAAEIAKQLAMETMEATLRKRLGSESPKPPMPAPKPAPPPVVRPGWEKMFSNFFKMRYEEGDKITYRKHWYVLIQKTWAPALINLALLGLVVYLVFSGILSGLLGAIFWLLVFLVTGSWWAYHYIDWRNDIYVLTRENILDIKRTPFTREEKKVASLGNILSLENARVGVMGILLNFGTVIINVGTEKFKFEGVFNPVQVQYEIFDRMYAYRRRKEEEEISKERERATDWLVAYHNVEKLEDVEKNQEEG